MKNTAQHTLRLMFQDEARFGRMSDPRACWAPSPFRPVVKFRYEYAAVSPWDGCLDSMTTEKMNTENMSIFLDQVSTAHSNEFTVMVLDGASSHKSKDLIIQENFALVLLPPYSPELNPVEQIWNVLQRNYIANRVFDSLDAEVEKAERGLKQMAEDKQSTRQVTSWPLISAILNT